MKCPNCGKEIAKDSVFCEFCGIKIHRTEENPANKSKVKWGQLIIGIIGFIIGGYGVLRSGGTVGLLLMVCVMGIIVFLAYISKKNK